MLHRVHVVLSQDMPVNLNRERGVGMAELPLSDFHPSRLEEHRRKAMPKCMKTNATARAGDVQPI
jgi:hypothetical protein